MALAVAEVAASAEAKKLLAAEIVCPLFPPLKQIPDYRLPPPYIVHVDEQPFPVARKKPTRRQRNKGGGPGRLARSLARRVACFAARRCSLRGAEGSALFSAGKSSR